MNKIILSTLALAAIFLAGCTQVPANPGVPSAPVVPTVSAPSTETPTAEPTKPAEGKTNLDTFAKCLTEKWAIIYTSPTCTHCMAQKKAFGESWQYIKDVNCMENPAQCGEIKAVPNWVINGENLVGEQSLEILAEKSGCSLYTKTN
jgi:glucose/arabinose dehydrogenase